MRRYTEDVRGLARDDRFDPTRNWYVCVQQDGTTYEARLGHVGNDWYNARTLPLRIARGDVVAVPVTDAKGRRIKR